MRWTLLYADIYETEKRGKILRGEWRKVSYSGRVQERRFGFRRVYGNPESIFVPTFYKHRLSDCTLAFLAKHCPEVLRGLK